MNRRGRRSKREPQIAYTLNLVETDEPATVNDRGWISSSAILTDPNRFDAGNQKVGEKIDGNAGPIFCFGP